MTQTTINQRITDLINLTQGGNKRQFAISIGVEAGVIENIVGKRQSKPSFDIINKLISSIDNINVSWLMTGEGEILLDKTEKGYKSNDEAMRANEATAPYKSKKQNVESDDDERRSLIGSINIMVETADRNSKTLEKIVNYLVSKDILESPTQQK